MWCGCVGGCVLMISHDFAGGGVGATHTPTLVKRNFTSDYLPLKFQPIYRQFHGFPTKFVGSYMNTLQKCRQFHEFSTKSEIS